MKLLIACVLTLLAVRLVVAADSPAPATTQAAGAGFTTLDPYEQVKTMGRGGQHHRLRPHLAQLRQRPLQGTPFSGDPRRRISDRAR